MRSKGSSSSSPATRPRQSVLHEEAESPLPAEGRARVLRTASSSADALLLHVCHRCPQVFSSPLTDDQIDTIMDALDQDGNGSLTYNEFLEGFTIVDTTKEKERD